MKDELEKFDNQSHRTRLMVNLFQSVGHGITSIKSQHLGAGKSSL